MFNIWVKQIDTSISFKGLFKIKRSYDASVDIIVADKGLNMNRLLKWCNFKTIEDCQYAHMSNFDLFSTISKHPLILVSEDWIVDLVKFIIEVDRVGHFSSDKSVLMIELQQKLFDNNQKFVLPIQSVLFSDNTGVSYETHDEDADTVSVFKNSNVDQDETSKLLLINSTVVSNDQNLTKCDNNANIQHNYNSHITNVLESLQQLYYSQGDDYRYISYK